MENMLIKYRNLWKRSLEQKKPCSQLQVQVPLNLQVMPLTSNRRDKVIVPSYTFSSTVNAILLAGAKPVFADIQEELGWEPSMSFEECI
ncbi:DegT/DnrJ/EryC1/StrS family aminotransferase [Methanosarcina sp. WWM596]|uniref:DegT/DnrJ/EryC1/StrS family aminotransferase n=1 Tax=Methanosarcina sp. WWM596 TaxID=1434103 RepID=UPI0035106E74